MKTATIYRVLLLTALFGVTQYAKAQFSFTNKNSLLSTQTHSGCCLVVADVNGDGLDDLIKLDQSNTLVIDLQNKNGTFTHYGNLATVSGSMWGMAVADVDHNGWKDVACGSGSCHLIYLSWSGSTITANNTTLAGSYFVQNITFGDFNNDGWADLYVCDDDDYGRVYINNGAGQLPPIGQSTTSLAIGTGSKNLTVQTGLSYTAGESIKVGYNGQHYMTGTVTSYNSGSGALVVNVTSVVGSGTYNGWSVDPNIVMDININPGLTIGGDPYDSGNYGSVWVDFDNDGDLDLYIAHCRQSASSSTDVRRRDRLFINNGDGTFTESAQAYGIEISVFNQTWTTSFGDIDNDGDFDIVMTNHGIAGQILRNDGTGHFTDITSSTGFSHPGMDPIESFVEDLDNDGWIDIVVTGGASSGDSYVMWHNNGNGTFTQNQAIPSAGHTMLSAGFGDLNHDGKIDILCSYGNVYNTPTTTADVMYFNTTTNANHFITFDLKGVVSNIGAIGARATIYGPWGKQIREVRAGESYGTANSFQLHFGVGANTVIDSARIDWPSGIVTNFTNLGVDRFVTVIEGQCSITDNVIPGPYILCASGSLNLNAPAGYTGYLWSNGATTQSISVSATGSYNVTVTNACGSNTSPTISIVQNPDETPTVTSTGNLTFCDGGSVTLTSTPATSYLWSPGGETTQAIQATAAGSYYVTIQGVCGPATSTNTVVSTLANPTASGSDQSWTGPHSFTLTATGNSLTWWDAPTAGTLLQSGTSYTTPVLSSTTTYWVENQTSYSNPPVDLGIMTGSGIYNNTIDGGLDFNALVACQLQSVKVYTDAAHHGIRRFVLQNSSGVGLDSIDVNITADSMVATLNFNVPFGNGYRLTTSATVNTANFGAVSPYFQRHNAGVAYPYTSSGLASITNGWTGTATSATAYYYFYDWKISNQPTVCTSTRIPIQAIINPLGINTFTSENNFKIYPNPSAGNITIAFNMAGAGESKVDFMDATGRVISSEMIENSGNSYQKNFDLGNFAKGMYTVHVSCGDKTSYQRLIIQ